MKIGAISLGCDKNRVDTEKMLARLVAGGHTLVGNEEDADVIVVNTCAFTDDAKSEAIDEILSAVEHKRHHKKKKIIVTGCLPQRYLDTLEKEFPQVDAFLGIADYDGICDTVDKITKGDKIYSCACGDSFYGGRVLTTPYHYAYLKIADGCNNHCTYCAIPSIRGKYRSEKMEDLLNEAKTLEKEGVKELILVAQDVTRYGVDFDGKSHLIELVNALSQMDFDLIRLLYLEPEAIDDDIIDMIVSNPKVAKYADVPLQHIDGDTLKRMGRRAGEDYTRALIKKMRERGITLRSSFICGFPGETEEAHQKLVEFIREGNIDYAGFFAYSREEGTPADRMDGHLDEEVKVARANRLKDIQTDVINKRNSQLVGKVIKVIYDEIDYDKQLFSGRASFQAPDIDNIVYFTADKEVHIGEFYDVEIVGVDGIDLVGKAI
ncbi:MAG: 30S ribosomal protein S12 methylthiotransferase RimO [Clostridia bacterium]|nr:30S ribosomal protein S12 methylthiotransferase RimO [Clostridia bacterium]